VAYHVYDGQFGKELAADIEEKAGFHVLGFAESGGFSLSRIQRGQLDHLET